MLPVEVWHRQQRPQAAVTQYSNCSVITDVETVITYYWEKLLYIWVMHYCPTLHIYLLNLYMWTDVDEITALNVMIYM